MARPLRIECPAGIAKAYRTYGYTLNEIARTSEFPTPQSGGAFIIMRPAATSADDA
jgi:hypothetical protein